MDEEKIQSNIGEACSNSAETEDRANASSPQVLKLEFKVEGLRLDSSPVRSQQSDDAVDGDLQYTLSWKADDLNVEESIQQDDGKGGSKSVEQTGSRTSSASSVAYNENAHKSIQLYLSQPSGEATPGTVHVRVSSNESSFTKSERDPSISSASNLSAHEITPDGSPKPAQNQTNHPNSNTAKLATRIITDPDLRKAVELFLNHQYMHGANGYITITVTFNPPQRLASSGEPATFINDAACPRCERLGKECRGGRPCVECKQEGKTDLLAKQCVRSDLKEGEGDCEGQVKTEAEAKVNDAELNVETPTSGMQEYFEHGDFDVPVVRNSSGQADPPSRRGNGREIRLWETGRRYE